MRTSLSRRRVVTSCAVAAMAVGVVGVGTASADYHTGGTGITLGGAFADSDERPRPDNDHHGACSAAHHDAFPLDHDTRGPDHVDDLHDHVDHHVDPAVLGNAAQAVGRRVR